ncbi:MAG: sulfotransferase [Actinomycetia bacterium]|nr:sulfotransferase [Actinomycetes bacterium]
MNIDGNGQPVEQQYSSWLFMVGTGRCGSSVLHEILARHEDVGFISNVEDRVPAARHLARWNNQIFHAIPPALTVKGRLRFAPSEAYRILDAEVSPALSRPSRDLTAEDLTPWLAQRLRTAFQTRAARQSTATFSHKLTGWPRTRLLAAAFPGARFVHVVRDGRAVANSFLQMPWWGGYERVGSWRYGPLPEEYERAWERSGRSFPVLAALTWGILMDAYAEAERSAAPGTWLTVRYEDVLAEPRRYLEQILGHVGLSWSPRVEAGLRRHRLRPPHSEHFRQDLDGRDVAEIEKVLRPQLQQYGYL